MSMISFSNVHCKIIPLLVTAFLVLPVSRLFAQETDEEDREKILTWSKAEEETLAKSGLFYDDPVYENYAGEVGKKLVQYIPGAEKVDFQFHTLRNPYLNAFAMATGALYVHTGLVARLQNEAQLAAVIAHEITHALEAHPVLGYTKSKSQTAGYQLLSIGTSIAFALAGGGSAGAYYGNQFAQLGLTLMTSASMSGYSREMEEAADIGGLKWMAAAGYDPDEIPKVFELFLKEYGDPGTLENFFWGDHPRNTTRMSYLKENIRKEYPGGKYPGEYRGEDVYRNRTTFLLREDARLNIEEGMCHTALAELDSFLLRKPDDPQALYLKGVAYYTMSSNPDTLSLSEKMLVKSIDLDPEFGKPNRMLAHKAEKDSLYQEAVAGYERYLALEPDAKDRLYIRWKIGELRKKIAGEPKVQEGGGQ